jgi:Ca2+-binding EF-hand superfamily protein
MTDLTSDQLERVKKAFKTRDANGDGTVSVDEFSAVLTPWMTEAEIKEYLKVANPNGDSEISYEEFLEDYKRDI